MINSNIKSTVTHTKVGLGVEFLDLKPTHGNSQFESFWTGVEYELMVQLLSGTVTNKTPIIGVTPESVVVTIPYLNDDEYDVEYISPPTLGECSWDDGEISCFLIKIVINVEGGKYNTVIDDCGGEIWIPTHTMKKSVFDITAIVDGVEYNGSTIEYKFHAFEDPFPIEINNAGTTYLDYLKPFDPVNHDGNGILFSNPYSVTSELLSTIFENTLTTHMTERTLNLAENISMIETADIAMVDYMGEQVGVSYSGFGDNSPQDLEMVMKFGSINPSIIFGHDDISVIMSNRNVGELIDPDDNITAGEHIFAISTDGGNPEHLIVDMIILDDNLTPDSNKLTTYPLADIQQGIYSTATHVFHREQGLRTNGFMGAMVNLQKIPYIPTHRQWFDLTKERVEYYILKHTIMDVAPD